MIVAAVLAVVAALEVRVPPGGCPTEPEVAAALAARLPAERQTTGWTLALVARPDGGDGARGVQVELRDARGATRLSRALVLAPARPAPDDADCRAAADAIALVVERYFSELGSGEEAASAGEVGPAARAVEPAAAPAPPPASEVRAARDDRRAQTAGAAPRAPRLEALVGAGVSRQHGWAARAPLELRGRALGPIEWGVGTWLPATSRSEPLGAGAAELTSWPLRLSLGAALPVGAALALGAAADAVISFETAESAGIPRVATSRRTVAAFGLSLATMWRLAPRWRLGAELAVQRGFGPAFVVADSGGGRRVLEPPSWQALGSLRLGFALLP